MKTANSIFANFLSYPLCCQNIAAVMKLEIFTTLEIKRNVCAISINKPPRKEKGI